MMVLVIGLASMPLNILAKSIEQSTSMFMFEGVNNDSPFNLIEWDRYEIIIDNEYEFILKKTMYYGFYIVTINRLLNIMTTNSYNIEGDLLFSTGEIDFQSNILHAHEMHANAMIDFEPMSIPGFWTRTDAGFAYHIYNSNPNNIINDFAHPTLGGVRVATPNFIPFPTTFAMTQFIRQTQNIRSEELRIPWIVRQSFLTQLMGYIGIGLVPFFKNPVAAAAAVVAGVASGILFLTGNIVGHMNRALITEVSYNLTHHIVNASNAFLTIRECSSFRPH